MNEVGNVSRCDRKPWLLYMKTVLGRFAECHDSWLTKTSSAIMRQTAHFVFCVELPQCTLKSKKTIYVTNRVSHVIQSKQSTLFNKWRFHWNIYRHVHPWRKWFLSNLCLQGWTKASVLSDLILSVRPTNCEETVHLMRKLPETKVVANHSRSWHHLSAVTLDNL